MAIVPSDIPTGALNVAREAAEAAGRMAIAYFRHGSQTTAGIDYKHGGSPVTEADLLVERVLVAEAFERDAQRVRLAAGHGKIVRAQDAIRARTLNGEGEGQ